MWVHQSKKLVEINTSELFNLRIETFLKKTPKETEEIDSTF